MATEQQTASSRPYYGIDNLVPPEVIEATVSAIAVKFQPQRIILFGSYAYGTPRPGSDVDLLVVMDTQLSGRAQAVEIDLSVDRPFALDLLVRTEAEVRERVAGGDFFMQEVVGRGKTKYAHPGSDAEAWQQLQRETLARLDVSEQWSKDALKLAGYYGVYELVPDKVMADTVAEIVEKFKPLKIILFGSYAYGMPRPGSDVDLLVVLDTSSEWEQSLKIATSIKRQFPLDLIVRTPTTIAERVADGDIFLSDVVSKGKVLYEARDS